MAIHKSALKRHRQNLKRRSRNRDVRATVRTEVKKTLQFIADGNREEAEKSARLTMRLMDKAVVHGVLHKNNARRRLSRLHRRLASAN